MNYAGFAYQAVPPAPGRPAAPGEAAAPQTTTTTSASEGTSGGAPPEGPGLIGMMPMVIMMIGLLMFMTWQTSSQRKKQDATIDALKVGDRVLTSSGLVGRLKEIGPRYAKLELTPGVKVEVLRSSLSGRDEKSDSDKDPKK